MDGRLNLVGQIISLASKGVQRLAGPVTVNQGKQQHLFYETINTWTAKTAEQEHLHTALSTVQSGTFHTVIRSCSYFILLNIIYVMLYVQYYIYMS